MCSIIVWFPWRRDWEIFFQPQLRLQPENEQVLSMYSAVETLRTEAEVASQLIHAQRYAEAVEVLSRIIPVCIALLSLVLFINIDT